MARHRHRDGDRGRFVLLLEILGLLTALATLAGAILRLL